MFSISSSSPAVVLVLVPLNAMCSRKCAVPLLAAVSYLLPASIHTPTVAVWACGVASVATRMPLGRVVTCAGRKKSLGGCLISRTLVGLFSRVTVIARVGGVGRTRGMFSPPIGCQTPVWS